MKVLAASIFLSSLTIGGALVYSSRVREDKDNTRPKSSARLSGDLHPDQAIITKDFVRKFVTEPGNQKLISDYCRKERGFEIDAGNPLWILAMSNESMIVVAYKATVSDGSTEEVELGFAQDQYGRYKMETTPPLYLNPQ